MVYINTISAIYGEDKFYGLGILEHSRTDLRNCIFIQSSGLLSEPSNTVGRASNFL